MELFLHNAPLVRILVPMLLGLLTALRFDSFSYSKPLWILVVMVAIVLLVSLDRVWKKMEKNHYFGFLSFLTFFLLGAGLSYRAIGDQEQPAHGDSYIALIESAPVEKANSYAVNLKVFKVQLDSQRYQSCSVRIIGYFSKEDLDSRILPGNVIRFSGRIANAEQKLYPNQFDYSKYLRNTGISGTAYIPRWSYDFIKVDQFSLKSQINKLRGSLLEKLNGDSIPVKEYGVISALLVGDRSFLDPQLRSDFADAGAVHILAVSGLHVGIIYLLFLKILNFLFKNKAKLLKFLMILFILWGYAALTGFSPSVLRAATMFSFIALGKYHKRYGNIYNMIAASAVLLLLINPLLITQIGFQLSYLAVIGIVFFFPKLYSLVVIENKYLDMLWSLICVSFAAQLATFPLSIYYFHQFPSLFLFTNILVIPLASVILHVGIGWILLIWIPYVSDFLEWVTVKLTWVLNGFIEMINTLSFAKIEGIHISGVSVFIIYLIIVLFTAFMIKPSRQALRFLGIAVICLTGIVLHRRISISLQDELLFPTLGDHPTIIRLFQNEVLVFSKDTAAFNSTWQRELYPYLLRRSSFEPEDIEFVNIGQEHEMLSVRRSIHSSKELQILYDFEKKQVIANTVNDGKLNLYESNVPLLQIEVQELTHFSNDSPLLQR